MKSRIVEPELLDHLPHDDPAARRSRADLRRINFLMGNERRVLRTLRRIPTGTANAICEIGAGDGSLTAKIKRRFPHFRITACDLAPRPPHLDPAIDWRCGDIFHHPPPPGGILVANLFLHHFKDGELAQLGRLCNDFSALVINEPDRSPLAALLGTLLHPFVNHITRHDMQVSIRAGFRNHELPCLLELDPARWILSETSTRRGARHLVAIRK